MADGSVTIEVNLDDKSAQKQLNTLAKSMEKLNKSIAENESTHNTLAEQLKQAQQEAISTYEKIQQLKAAIAENDKTLNFHTSGKDVNAEQFAEAKENQAKLNAELAQAEKLLEKQEAAALKLEEKDTAVLDKLHEQTAELEKQQGQAGQIMDSQAKQAQAGMENLKASAGAASETATRALPSFSKLFKSVLKWGLGIRSVFILVRRLKAAVIEYYTTLAKSDNETKEHLTAFKASLAELKGAFGAAFAPIINAVIPALTTLINWLTAAMNAIARFMAVLTGKTYYGKAVANTDKIKQGIEGVGGAAAEANKQLMKFDELNVLNDNSGGGGGGGGAYSTEREDIDMQSYGAKLALNLKDILFTWDDLNPEVIAKKVLGVLGMLTGGAIGFAIGGIPGAIIGATAGLLLSANIESFIFNNDGTLSKDEIIKSILIVLGAVLGGVAGFILGGVPGAAFGIVLGATLVMAAGNIKFQGASDIGAKFKKWIWDDGILAMWNEIKTLWQETISSFKFDPPQVKLPHIGIDWRDAGGLAKFFGISQIPSLNVQWYARGGIVNSPTLFGAGEAGKEAVIPLERHTEWIKMVADGIADILIDRFAGAMPAMPAMAGGNIIPPQMEYALGKDGGNADSGLNALLMDIASKLDALNDRPIEVNSPVYIDKRKIGEAVSEYQRSNERARGR